MSLKIKVITDSPNWPLSRQIDHSLYDNLNIQFSVNDLSQSADFLIIYEGICESKVELLCNYNYVIFFAGEPPDIKFYSKQFLNQFDLIITTHKQSKHKNKILSHTALPWHFGLQKTASGYDYLNYDQLIKSEDSLLKEKYLLLSTVCSNKKTTPFHRRRLEFVNKLKKVLPPDSFQVFGRGFNTISDKSEAITPFKYHLVLENSSLDHYWTEKLSDAYLGVSFPIYFGCRNIHDYFNQNQLVQLDDLSSLSIDKVIKLIASEQYKEKSNDILLARRKILQEYNLFSLIYDHCLAAMKNISKNPKTRVIHNEKTFNTGLQKILYKGKRVFQRGLDLLRYR